MSSSKSIRRVAAIHDLSCFGRCALTVVIPVLSAMGIQVVPIPTALLSTHTGGFEDMHFRSLTGDMSAISAHFDRLDLHFDAIYTGFLGSAEQISTVSEIAERFGGEDCTVLVDPVMGDDGRLYSTYTDELAYGMRGLCRVADVITPNLTEACYLTGNEFPVEGASDKEIDALATELCRELHGLFGCDVVITGIEFDGSRIGCCYTHGESTRTYATDKVAASYPGTGDIFASVMLGKLLSGSSLDEAVHRAADFTHLAVYRSLNDYPAPLREGIAIEPLLWELV